MSSGRERTSFSAWDLARMFVDVDEICGDFAVGMGEGDGAVEGVGVVGVVGGGGLGFGEVEEAGRV